MLSNLFGKKKTAASTVSSTSSSRASDPQVTIVKLREAISVQEKREQHIEHKVLSMVKEAKAKMAKGDKKGALFAMKRKKMYEAEVEKITNVKFTLESQVINLESAAQNAQTFQAMQAGTKTMQNIRQQVGIDKVDDVMDNIKEEMEQAQEINDAMAQPVDPFMADEAELLAELGALETEELEEKLLQTPAALPSMPTAPDSTLPAHANKDEDDLKQLEAELAGL